MTDSEIKSAFNIKRHGDPDLHYIGESLPVPASVADLGDTSTVGESPFPARADHLHNLVPVTGTYTPTLTGMAVGTTSAVNTATYWYIAGFLYIEGQIIFGSAGSTLPTGAIYFDLPSGYTYNGSTLATSEISWVEFVETGVTTYMGTLRYNSSSNRFRFICFDGNTATYVRTAGTGAASPFTWAALDGINYRLLIPATRA